MVKKSFGYTLIELLVVIAVTGVIAVIAFYAIGSFNSGQNVISAQREFVSTLRAAQNRVTNGAEATPILTVLLPAARNSYTIGNAVTNTSVLSGLPKGVTFTVTDVATNNVLSGDLSLCFVNRSLASYDDTVSAHTCGGCVSGSGFICSGTTILSNTAINVNFSSGGNTKIAAIEGSGIYIDRMYVR